MEYLINSAIGAAGGWLMGQLKQGGNFGTVGNLVAGVLGGNAGGSLLGSTLSGLLGGGAATAATGGGVGSWLASALGSIVLTYLSKFIPGGAKS
jgi:uncharacterized membrane protein YeaQ/YmgE (transglycosylase-associated protein family)